jgi:hypothetical protein
LIRLSAINLIEPIPGMVDASFATLSNVALDGSLPTTATVTGYGLTSVDGPLDPYATLARRYGVAATDPIGPPPPPVDPGFPYDCSLPMILCTYDTTGGAMWLDYGGGEVVAGINSFIFDEADLTDPPGTPNWDDGYWTVGRPPPITRTGSGAMSPTPCSPARPYLSRPRSGCWDPDCWV